MSQWGRPGCCNQMQLFFSPLFRVPAPYPSSETRCIVRSCVIVCGWCRYFQSLVTVGQPCRTSGDGRKEPVRDDSVHALAPWENRSKWARQSRIPKYHLPRRLPEWFDCLSCLGRSRPCMQARPMSPQDREENTSDESRDTIPIQITPSEPQTREARGQSCRSTPPPPPNHKTMPRNRT